MQRPSASPAGCPEPVIGKVCKRGADVRRLLGYLFREGLAGEHGLTAPHTAPRLIAAWDGVAGLEPPRTAGEGRDLARLAGALSAPLLAAGLDQQEWKDARPVYHLAISAAADDRQLTDDQWADIAAEYVDRIGLAPRGDEAAVRWVAVRHADNHVHVVATLARQDGRRVWPRNDFYRSREASLAVEARYGLRCTSPADRTGSRETTRGEQRRHQADQQRRRQAGRSPAAGPDREVLRRRVRLAATGTNDLPGFLERLRTDGVMVRERHSQRDPDQVTGYAVALRGDGEPVWFGGGKLAPDLTLPKLQALWAKTLSDAHRPEREGGPPLSPLQRARILKAAELAASRAAEHVWTQSNDPAAVAAAADAAWAASDLIGAAARVAEGTHRAGPLTEAADRYERAAREPYLRRPSPTASGRRLREAATSLLAMRRVLPSESRQLLKLVTQLEALAVAVGRLREAQGRAAQAAAARAAAEHLAAARGQQAQPRSVPPTIRLVPDLPRAFRTSPGRPSGRSL